jgi:hypothetical protein
VGELAPIALFVYKRADHLQATLTSLKSCNGFGRSKIIVFGDGAKTERDLEAVEAARRVARDQLGLSAEYRFNRDNRGLALSIIQGVDEVTKTYGRAIVLEDDLLVSPNFLQFMNDALARYENDPRVFQVSGHMFNAPEFQRRTTALFLPFTTTWGWATWRRAWIRFDPFAEGWTALRTDAALRTRFNLDGAYDYASMLEQQMAGFRDSWGIRWYWSAYKNKGVACFPPVPLVRNIGMDGTGTHGRGVLRRFNDGSAPKGANPIVFPSTVSLDPQDYLAVTRAIRRQNGGWIGATADRVRRRFGFLLRRRG